ncbi:beta-N-acetylhexosaminidase family protein [Amycolatopsis anabasis]|uniref:beta-N-acetylhexosaminidase family protein n=1 Tax=Amycolatopsis anabasis TaxID=1840409 RepID=UPI00131C3E04|nr:beta-N-acetylglucosaminidase domain-containing protein [Amycolatopsis anabasis]
MPTHLIDRPDGFALVAGASLALVRGPGADPAAERIVRDALAARGIAEGAGTPDLVVRIGEEPIGDRMPGAYRLSIGRGSDGRGRIVLDGSDPAGTWYAAREFRRLAERSAELPGVELRDRPAVRYRGSIEGFYGTPWSHADRLAHLDFLGAHRMNAYVYAPKDDGYHREKWRDPYPPETLAELAELVRRARDNHVTFVFAVSPGLSMRYSVTGDLAALLAKFDALHAAGCRAFAVALDDIDYRTWHCAADRERFGGDSPGASAGRAHAWLVGEVVRWARSHGDVEPVQLVPTEYHGLADTPYKRALRERLDPGVLVWWTGHDVVPRTIERAEAARAAALFGHEILLWDNYPVNDYLPGRVPLGDYSGRENGLSAHVVGVLANPMNQPAMSSVALSSVAAYGWDDTGFDARRAWRSALAELAGGRADVLAALEAFADVNTLDERLHLVQAPEHAEACAAFRAEWAAGDTGAALARLRGLASRLAAAPGTIRAGVADPRFAAEAAAWLDATELWGRALAAAATMLGELVAGDRPAARRAGVLVAELAERARTPRDTRLPHRDVPVKVADGVLDRFLTELLEILSSAGDGPHNVATLPQLPTESR